MQDSVCVVALFQKGHDQLRQASVQREEIVVANVPAIPQDVDLEQRMGRQCGDVARRDNRVIGGGEDRQGDGQFGDVAGPHTIGVQVFVDIVEPI